MTEPETDAARVRYPKNPARDAELTRAFHAMLASAVPPPNPDAPPAGTRLGIIGWVRMDVRFLK